MLVMNGLTACMNALTVRVHERVDERVDSLHERVDSLHERVDSRHEGSCYALAGQLSAVLHRDRLRLFRITVEHYGMHQRRISCGLRGGCARRNNYVTCAIISILAHATQFNPLSQHLSVFVRFVPAVTLTCGILAAVRRFSVG